jgi:hypothetical protein
MNRVGQVGTGAESCAPLQSSAMLLSLLLTHLPFPKWQGHLFCPTGDAALLLGGLRIHFCWLHQGRVSHRSSSGLKAQQWLFLFMNGQGPMRSWTKTVRYWSAEHHPSYFCSRCCLPFLASSLSHWKMAARPVVSNGGHTNLNGARFKSYC